MTPLRLLLVGNHEEDFFLIREMLERNRSLIAADLEHARSLEEARELMQHRPYGRLLFEHDAGDDEAVRRATAEFLRLQGYNRIEARDGVDALALAQEQTTIHLLASDVVMPRMSRGALRKRGRTSAPQHAVSVCFRLCGKDDPRPQGGGSGNELSAKALHAEATVVPDSQGAGYRAGWSIGRVTLLELWVCSWWRARRARRPRQSRRGRRRYGRPRYNTAGSAPGFFAQRAPFP